MKGDFQSLALLSFFILAFSCTGSSEKRREDIKLQQYMITGKEIYLTRCSMCHQPEGEGLAKLYPPVNRSDYMENHLEEVICIIKYGRKEPLMVNGILYTQPMPGVPALTNLEIAQVATYIYNSWKHDRGIIDVKEVDRIMRQCDN